MSIERIGVTTGFALLVIFSFAAILTTSAQANCEVYFDDARLLPEDARTLLAENAGSRLVICEVAAMPDVIYALASPLRRSAASVCAFTEIDLKQQLQADGTKRWRESGETAELFYSSPSLSCPRQSYETYTRVKGVNAENFLRMARFMKTILADRKKFEAALSKDIEAFKDVIMKTADDEFFPNAGERTGRLKWISANSQGYEIDVQGKRDLIQLDLRNTEGHFEITNFGVVIVD